MMPGTDDGLFVYPPYLVVGSTEDRRFTEKYRIFGSTQTLRKNNSAKKLLEKVLALQTTLAEHIRVVLSDPLWSRSVVDTGNCALISKSSGANDGHQMTCHSFTE